LATTEREDERKKEAEKRNRQQERQPTYCSLSLFLDAKMHTYSEIKPCFSSHRLYSFSVAQVVHILVPKYGINKKVKEVNAGSALHAFHQ
jgi:hypothetical protein